MIFNSRGIAAALAVTAVLAVGARAGSARADGFPSFPFPGAPGLGGPTLGAGGAAFAGPCASASQEGQGPTGGTANEVCGAGLTFIGPSIGQIASVVGPTIIGPAAVGNIVVSAGNGNAG
jgi:hypothetical protein